MLEIILRILIQQERNESVDNSFEWRIVSVENVPLRILRGVSLRDEIVMGYRGKKKRKLIASFSLYKRLFDPLDETGYPH